MNPISENSALTTQDTSHIPNAGESEIQKRISSLSHRILLLKTAHEGFISRDTRDLLCAQGIVEEEIQDIQSIRGRLIGGGGGQSSERADTHSFSNEKQEGTTAQLEMAQIGTKEPCWRTLQDFLNQFHPDALLWFQCCAFLSTESIPIQWLDKWLQEKGFIHFLKQRNAILDVLGNKGLIHYDHDQGIFSLNRIYQNHCRLSLPEENKGKILNKALQLLNHIASNLDCKKFSNGAGLNIWALHAKAILMLQLEDSPELATLLNQFGNWMELKGEYRIGFECHEAALRIGKNLRKDPLFIIESLLHTASCSCGMGKYIEGEKYCREAISMMERGAVKHDDPMMGQIYNCFGNCLVGTKDCEEAFQQFKKALENTKNAFDDENLNITDVWNNIGTWWSNKGFYRKALSFHGKAFEIRTKFLGMNDPSVAQSLNNLGVCMIGLKKYEEAYKLLKHAFEIWKKSLGWQHPYIATSLHNIGVCLFGSGSYEDALINITQAFVIACNCFKQDHPHIVMYLRNVVLCLKRLNNKEINYKTKKKLFPLCKKYLGKNHECTHLLSSLKTRKRSFGYQQIKLKRSFSV